MCEELQTTECTQACAEGLLKAAHVDFHHNTIVTR
jgi:hypothetical protein